MGKTKIVFVALATILAASSCSNSDSNTAADKTVASTDSTKSTSAIAPSINIRFIDEDSVSANYNLAKDFKEASIRAFSRLESAQQSKAKEIQSFGAQIEQKARSNGYLSEQSYQGDMAKLNKMQEQAQTYLANMQRNTEMELAQQQQQLNDSLQAFIKDYNKKKGYDAILFKAAGVYFNPALDITNEVIEGLNARYNKVQKK